MSKILATNTSSSNPGKQYEIIEGDDGVVYCTCPGWKFKRDCKHLRAYNNTAGYVAEHMSPSWLEKHIATDEPNNEDILTKLKGVRL